MSLALPPGTCDTHIHFYDRSYRAASTTVLKPPDATRGDYEKVRAELGIDRCVVVQPTTYGLDNSCQLDAVDVLGTDIARAVVVDETVTDAELAYFGHRGVRGVRFHMLPGGAVGWDALTPIISTPCSACRAGSSSTTSDGSCHRSSQTASRSTRPHCSPANSSTAIPVDSRRHRPPPCPGLQSGEPVPIPDPEGANTMNRPAAPPNPTIERSYASYPSLMDKRVFVTGGGNGIGQAIVHEFAKQGARVAFVDIDADGGAGTVEVCAADNPRHTPMFIKCDLTDIDALRSAIDAAQREQGPSQVLVNNAASDDRHTWEEMTPDYWDDRVAVNLRHYFFAIQAIAPAMLEAAEGSIVNIGSSCYLMQEDFFPGYAIAKSGVEGITRTMARTFGVDNVRVNTVMPGWVATDHQLERWWSPEGEEGTLADQALKRRILPDEFAQMVLFLAADDGAACTAQTFLIDGGRY
ncbi:MAG: SDR family oxidoreductase [Actinomycetia bacterium]|nr:SDR family oxidoreductase [Actinomycetes bacterium]